MEEGKPGLRTREAAMLGGDYKGDEIRGHCSLFLYQADILLGFSDPLHLREIWYGCALTHRILVLYLPIK